MHSISVQEHMAFLQTPDDELTVRAYTDRLKEAGEEDDALFLLHYQRNLEMSPVLDRYAEGIALLLENLLGVGVFPVAVSGLNSLQMCFGESICGPGTWDRDIFVKLREILTPVINKPLAGWRGRNRIRLLWATGHMDELVIKCKLWHLPILKGYLESELRKKQAAQQIAN